MSLTDFITKTKIFSRVTSSTVILFGLYVVSQYMTSDSIQPEILAVAAGIIGSATTFLFMSEKQLKKLLNKKNISKVKNKSGIYKLYGSSKKPIYVGTSKIMKHRLQSYYQKDDFSVNKTKKKLRNKIKSFSINYKSITKARKSEKRIKKNTKFNFN